MSYLISEVQEAFYILQWLVAGENGFLGDFVTRLVAMELKIDIDFATTHLHIWEAALAKGHKRTL